MWFTPPIRSDNVRLSMKRMQASLDFDKDVETFLHEKGVTRIPLVTEGSLNSSSLRNGFTSDDDEGNHKDGTKDESERTDENDGGESYWQDTGSSPELVLALTKEAHQQLGLTEEGAVKDLLKYLSEKKKQSPSELPI